VDPRGRGKIGTSTFTPLIVFLFTMKLYLYIVLQVHAWLMHFVYPIEGNVKLGGKFLGAIVDTYNNNTEPHCQRTAKNMKDRWSTYNKQVSLFNQIYN
jgi:hypothetical protein